MTNILNGDSYTSLESINRFTRLIRLIDSSDSVKHYEAVWFRMFIIVFLSL